MADSQHQSPPATQSKISTPVSPDLIRGPLSCPLAAGLEMCPLRKPRATPLPLCPHPPRVGSGSRPELRRVVRGSTKGSVPKRDHEGSRRSPAKEGAVGAPETKGEGAGRAALLPNRKRALAGGSDPKCRREVPPCSTSRTDCASARAKPMGTGRYPATYPMAASLPVTHAFKGRSGAVSAPCVLLACTSTGAILFHAPGRAVTAPVAPAPVTRWLPRDGRPPAGHLFSSQTEFQTRPFRDIRPPHQARSARDALSEKVRTGYGRSNGAGISFYAVCNLRSSARYDRRSCSQSLSQ